MEAIEQPAVLESLELFAREVMPQFKKPDVPAAGARP
jgi:hypothetical protein